MIKEEIKELFAEYFKCPCCGNPIAEREELRSWIMMGHKYCGYCGEKITTAIKEAAGIF